MSLDVVYQGLSIAKGARVRFEDGGLFVEVDGPMPVATQLLLSHEGRSLVGRVRRVREGAGAGMLIAAVEPPQLPRWLMPMSPDTVAAGHFEPEAPPPPVVEAAPTAPAVEPASSASPEAHAEPAPSTRTPDGEGEGAAAASSEGEDEEGKHAASAKPGDKKHTGGTAAAKGKKKPRRR